MLRACPHFTSQREREIRRERERKRKRERITHN